MMFVGYTVALGVMAFAYEQPDLFLMAALLVLARRVFR